MKSVRKLISLLVAILLLMAFASPSGAHTNVDKTKPANGDSVSAGKLVLAVTFTDKILDLADSSEIVLKGESGSVSGVGCVTVTERGINAEAFIGTAGNYQVSWRTVAEDGHPIDGSFKFTVSGNSDGEALTCKDGVTVTIPEEAEPTVISEPNNEEPDSALGDVYNYLIGGALVAVAIVILLLLRRPKATK